MIQLRKPPLWPALCGILLFAVGSVALARWWQRFPLEAHPSGCAFLQRGPEGPLCVLLDQTEVRVLVQTDAGSQVGFATPTEMQQPSRQERGERLLTLPATPGPLRVNARDHRGLRRREVRLSIQTLAEHFRDQPWVAEAHQRWEANKTAEAARILDQHPDATGEAAAHRLYLLASIAEERAEHQQAQVLLTQAADAAHDVGIWSMEANAALRLAMLHLRMERPAETERWMGRIEAVLHHAPYLRANWLFQGALIRQARGDLRGAHDLFSQGIYEATRFGNAKALAGLHMAQGKLLRDLGRTAEADRAIERATRITGLAPCRRAFFFNDHGRHRITARQALPQQDRLWQALDPEPPLREALRLYTESCDITWRRAEALTNLAHAAVLSGRDAGDLLQQARQALGGKEPEASLKVEWAELEGEIALYRGDPARARAAFGELLRLAPAQSTYEATWRALVGLARAAATPEEALTFLQRAEDHLDRRALDLPLGTGRGSFLGRFERGTAQHVELLAERDPARAFEVARHARVRGLRALAQAARLETLAPEKRANWEKALSRYQALHKELDKLFADNATAPKDEQLPDLEQRRELLGRELSDQIDQRLRELGAPRQDAFRPPNPGEVLLLCFPRPRGGARCFARDTTGVLQVALEQVSREALSDTLLPALRERLRAATRLTVLAYGEARQIPFHLLPDPLTKAPLWDRLEVVYALDLPAAPAATGTERSALLLCDTAADAPGSCPATTQAQATLTRAGWRAQLQRPSLVMGGARAEPRMNREMLLKELGQVRLFHYIGHMKAEGLRGALPLEDEAGLLTADVLTLPRAPERVLLFACNSGKAGEETGGLEGLGLAQAFLLRGAAWAIAPVQDVDVALSDRLVQALYQQDGLGGDAPAPVRLLREARRVLLAQGAGPVADLDAFRVFVP